MPANDGTAMKQFKRYMTVRLFNPRRSALVLQMRPWLPRSHRRLPEERSGSFFACNACDCLCGLCDCFCCHCTSGCGKRWWCRVRPFEDICLRKFFLGVRHGALEHLDQDLRNAYEFDNLPFLVIKAILLDTRFRADYVPSIERSSGGPFWKGGKALLRAPCATNLEPELKLLGRLV